MRAQARSEAPGRGARVGAFRRAVSPRVRERAKLSPTHVCREGGRAARAHTRTRAHAHAHALTYAKSHTRIRAHGHLQHRASSFACEMPSLVQIISSSVQEMLISACSRCRRVDSINSELSRSEAEATRWSRRALGFEIGSMFRLTPLRLTVKASSSRVKNSNGNLKLSCRQLFVAHL
eukprot:6193792-Pleurochrysis_carterae.AAC.2